MNDHTFAFVVDAVDGGSIHVAWRPDGAPGFMCGQRVPLWPRIVELRSVSNEPFCPTCFEALAIWRNSHGCDAKVPCVKWDEYVQSVESRCLRCVVDHCPSVVDLTKSRD